jgi:hypothetical protein
MASRFSSWADRAAEPKVHEIKVLGLCRAHVIVSVLGTHSQPLLPTVKVANRPTGCQTLGWERDGEVKAMLAAAASQVQPIMRKRGWRVPLLAEFYPAQRNLLGLNVGGGGGERLSPCEGGGGWVAFVRSQLRSAGRQTLHTKSCHMHGALASMTLRFW